ncbi:441c4d0b-cb68-4168-85f7-b4c29d5f8b4e-CDS [Sclerotinia trifoliorum]|uniref:441c4d0b-cb68-4168-85f7-b4c29d5f8b4e-CDS n=1 Tax=Sclerotinia trifoliorum TaxID=28548 RepID=A0A8H2W301_9HELO|nr:441c4d0b-cb68-4168-85f7-b4c29d5f8b4e-CDS [Sclerotinia trifoliorum]
MSSSDSKGKEGKGKAVALVPAPAEMKSNNIHKADNGNGDNMHIPTKRDEQPQSSLLARVGSSAIGLGRDVFSGVGSEREGGEGLRRDMVGLLSRSGDGKAGGSGGGSGSGSGSFAGSSSLREAGVGFAGPASRSEGMRSSSLGNNDLEGNAVDENASESQGERARHVQRSENEFSEFLDGVPSLMPADDLGFATASASGAGFGNQSQIRDQVDYAASSSSDSGAGFGFGTDYLSQGNTNMFWGSADAEGKRGGGGIDSDLGRFNLEHGSKSNLDLIQGSTNSDWGNVWARTTGAPASTSTEQVQNPQAKIDKLENFDMDKFSGEPGTSSNISSNGENGKVSSSGYSERSGSKIVGYIHTDVSEQEKRDGEDVRQILSKIGGTNLDFEEEMEELLTEQKAWAENEQEMKGYEWEWKWGMSEEERERIRKITRDLLFPEPAVHQIPKGDHSLNLIPGYEREREERWREERKGNGEDDTKEDMFAGVMFKNKIDHEKGKVMEEWKSDWEGVLRRYTDEVWGGLLPLVVEAREELQREEKEGETGEGKDSGDLKALRRLGAVLGHLKGIGREL